VRGRGWPLTCFFLSLRARKDAKEEGTELVHAECEVGQACQDSPSCSLYAKY